MNWNLNLKVSLKIAFRGAYKLIVELKYGTVHTISRIQHAELQKKSVKSVN